MCPWRPAGTIQHQGNVWLVQNPLPCLPCDRLGCENRLDGYSRCLDNLSVATVLSAVDAALATRAR
jgi:heptosyltransferase-3